MRERIEKLESEEQSTAEMIERKINKTEVKREKKKALEDKIRAEIEEKEKKLLIAGFPITSASHEAMLPGLLAAMLRPGCTPQTRRLASYG